MHRSVACALLLASAQTAACKKQEPQSLPAALELLCDAPRVLALDELAARERSQRLTAYLEEHVRHPQGRALIASAAASDPSAAGDLRAAVDAAGLTACPLIDEPVVESELPPARLPSAPAVALSSDVPLTRVVVDAAGIALAGQRVVALERGVVAPALLVGRDEDLVIEPLRSALKSHALEIEAIPPLGIVIDRAAPFVLLEHVLRTARETGFEELALIALGDEGLGALPVSLPRGHRSAQPAEAAGEGAMLLKPVVTILGQRLILWSASGIEGTMQSPRLSLAAATPAPSFDLAPLSVSLAELVARHWPGERPGDSERIVLMFDGATPVQTVVDVIAAVRATAEGRPLFPHVGLSSGLRELAARAGTPP